MFVSEVEWFLDKSRQSTKGQKIWFCSKPKSLLMDSSAHLISNTTSLWLNFFSSVTAVTKLDANIRSNININGFVIFASALLRFASEEHIVRLLQVHQDIENRGRYVLTFDELEYGVRLAWRNAPRCIARVQWPTLKVKCWIKSLLLFQSVRQNVSWPAIYVMNSTLDIGFRRSPCAVSPRNVQLYYRTHHLCHKPRPTSFGDHRLSSSRGRTARFSYMEQPIN